MTNKKKESLFSRLKSKLFSKSEQGDFELIDDEEEEYETLSDDYEERYHTDEDDVTDPGYVMEEVPSLPVDADEDVFYEDDSDEDEILETLQKEAPLSLDEDDEDFVPRPMNLSEDQKAELENELADLDEEFPEVAMEMPRPEKTREIDLAQLAAEDSIADEDHYEEDHGDFSEFTLPNSTPGIKGKLLGIVQKVKSIGSGKKHKPSFTPKKPSFIKLPDNFDWDKTFDSLFSPELRPAIHRGFLALLFAFSTYGMGKLSALALKGTNLPVGNLATSLPSKGKYFAKREMNIVAVTDLFNAPGEARKPNLNDLNPIRDRSKDPKICATSDQESSLSIKLVNTLVLQDSVKSIAAVQVRNDKEVLNIREGEKIKDMAEIGRIDRQKMIFKNLKTGTCEFIANEDKNLKRITPLKILKPKDGKKLLNQQRDGIKNAGDSYKIPSKVREEMLSNISEVLTQARAVQINNPDGSLSFKLTEIVPNSIYSKLDIQNDDVIKTINGKKITNINEVMTLFGNIRQIDQFELGILRNGAEINKDYNFE
jgi:type II secretory pathway component PulC